MTLQPREVPLGPGFLERAAAAVRYASTGDASQWNIWFGPGAPPTPQQPEVGGRQNDYQTAINMQWQPRVGEPIGFQTLRDLADGYDLLRLVIETRKDQLAKLEWSIKPRDKKAKPDARCEEIQGFLQCPDRVHGWDQWNRMFWEDVLVVDALTILPRKTLGGDPYALDIIDGTTIKPIIGADGRQPMDGPAFQQVIKGIPVANFTSQELVYRPHNVRSHKIYGYGKVEQVLTTVNIALRRQIYQLQYYTEGSAPDLIFSVPDTWNPNQIKAFAEWWWSMLGNGNTAQKRKGMFVPAGVKPVDVKEQALKDLYDEWLARIICYAFSVPPQALVKEQNRATASTQKDMSKEEGLLPLMTYQKGVMDGILRDFFDAPDLQFSWSQEAATSPEDQAKIDASDVQAGIRLVNEVRADRGLEPLPEPEPDVLPEGGAPVNGERPQDTALNGPQIASLLQIVQAAAGASIPVESAEAVIRASFPSLPAETVTAMMAAVKPKEPELPSPASGAAPNVQGQDAAPAASASTVEQPDGAGKPAEKLAKAKKTVKPLKRQRPLVMKLQARIEKTVSAYLKGAIRPIAGEIHAAMPAKKLAKMDQEEARQILASLGLDFSDLGDDLEPLLAAIAADGGSQALAQLGITESSIVDQVNEDAVAWAKQHAAELVTQLAETTREKIQSDLVNAIESGMSVDDIASSLASTYGFSDDRAHLIAQTERAFADVAGNRKAYAASGVVGSIEWSCANGGDGVEGSDSPCPECEENDGQSVPLGKDGEATEPFPSGATTVPAHPGCFCDLLPVINDDETPED